MPEEEFVTSRFALWRAALFPLPFLALFAYLTGQAVLAPDRFLIQGLSPTLLGWTKWLVLGVLGVAVVWLAWRMWRFKAVTLVGESVLIRGFFSRVEVPIEMIVEADWVQNPSLNYTPVAELLLRQPCLFGDRILFEPRSPEAFQHLANLLRRRTSTG